MPALHQQQVLNQIVNSNFTGAPIPAPDVTILSAVVVMSSGSGAGNLSIFFEGSCDGVDWSPMVPSWGQDFRNGVPVTYGNFSGSLPNVVAGAIGTSGNGNSNATFAHFGFTMYRVRATAVPTVSFNVRVNVSGK